MSKAIQDIPSEQRPFFKHFEKVAYRHQYSEVFDDYLTILINWFANGEQQAWRDQALAKYTPEEKAELNLMFKTHMQLNYDMIITKGEKWYDSLGDIYQTVTGNWKSSGMGQFFTPGNITDMMAAMVVGTDSPYSMVSEPCSGSGRMILSAHALQPLNYYHAIDLDLICAKMTAINMCLHNAAGVVTHGNSLTLTNYRHFIITRVRLDDTNYLPYLRVTEDHAEAANHLAWLREYCRIMRGEKRQPVEEVKIKEPVKMTENGRTYESQLTLF